MNIVDRKVAVNVGPAMAAAQQAQAAAASAQATASSASSVATALNAAMALQAIRQINVQTPLLPIGTTNVAVVWPTAMPDADYSVVVSVDSAPAVLGRITAAPVQGTKTVTGFTLAVTAGGVLPIAIGQGTLNCIGIRLANPV